jgi:hypothetical protein
MGGGGGERHASAALHSGKIHATHCTEDCVGLSTGLTGCGKYRPHRNSNSGPSSPNSLLFPVRKLPNT